MHLSGAIHITPEARCSCLRSPTPGPFNLGLFSVPGLVARIQARPRGPGPAAGCPTDLLVQSLGLKGQRGKCREAFRAAPALT
jgi:hypothetical protein